jgi:sulfur-oxidizing protein SoxY
MPQQAAPPPIARPPAAPRRRFLGLLGWTLAWLAQGPAAWAKGKPARNQPVVPVTPPPAEDFSQVLAAALRGQPWAPSDAVRMEIPQLAENGAIVPITVESLLPDTRRILIFAEKNPGPLLAEFHFEPGADAWVALRLKLNETGPVLAIAEAGGQFHGAQTTVKVMIGGCG